jgi:four helix bundle protein
MAERKYDLEDRLIEYAAAVIQLTEVMPNTRAANHVGGQLLRPCTSPLFNHGEAQAAKSPNDFVHKMKICLKELRESQRAVRLVQKVQLIADVTRVEPLFRETEELIRIFFASHRTAQTNKLREAPEDDYGA